MVNLKQIFLYKQNRELMEVKVIHSVFLSGYWRKVHLRRYPAPHSVIHVVNPSNDQTKIATSIYVFITLNYIKEITSKMVFRFD